MYLIAACLPALDIILTRFLFIINTSSKTLKEWQRSLRRNSSSRDAEAQRNPEQDEGQSTGPPKVDVALTGQGNMLSLVALEI